MMIRYNLLLGILFILTISLSCSIKYRINDYAVNKALIALSESEKGDIFFENDNTKVYFNKNDVLKAFAAIKRYKWITYCERIQLEEYETRIRNAIYEVNLFIDLSKNTLDYCGEFDGRILEELLLNHDFVILNKENNRYEEKILYSKWGDKFGCCFAGFYFLNKERFVMTRVFTDQVIIEDCDSIPKN
jgi:hypothetical protein